MNTASFVSSLGTFYLYSDGQNIVGLSFSKPENFTEQTDEVLNKAKTQLSEYFAGKRKVFDISLKFGGTPFQNLVWKALLDIPYGEVRTYGDIAKIIGKPKASRAVGRACHNNPIGIIIPCHRVIGAGGKLTGFGGGTELKEKLLDLER